MSWDDDSWRDGYDAWKLASPYDDEDPCDHEDYEADVLNGRASCNICSHAWWLTNEELKAEHRRIAAYGEWVAEQYRRERWEWIFRLWDRFKPRWPSRKAQVSDDLPF